MKKLLFIRREDYWIYFLGSIGIFLAACAMYAGVMYLRILTGLPAFAILYFLTYIIRKNYSRPQSIFFLVWNLLLAILLAMAAYYLTN